ncbi:MAG: hypothetical protein ABIQ01_01100 [Pseudolysinimonas sp.]
MSLDSGLAVGTRPTAEAPLDLAGWAGAATAVHACQQIPVPMTLRLDVAGHDVIAIDFAFNAFEWSGSLAEFPAEPAAVLVETRPGVPGTPSLILPGLPLDPLLWSIGFHAFGGDPAPWLIPGTRYRLRRWPSLAGISIDLDQVRMIAMLGNAFATADELAAAAGTLPEKARRLINALSVAGILRRSVGAPPLDAAVQTAAPTASGHPAVGLFARLRERWGR